MTDAVGGGGGGGECLTVYRGAWRERGERERRDFIWTLY